MGSLMAATGLGLEPNTPRQHAWLVPYKRREMQRDQNRRVVRDEDGRPIWQEWFECQLMIGYRGFVELMGRARLVVQAETVYEVDRLVEITGTGGRLEFSKELRRERYSTPDDWAAYLAETNADRL
jgi:recombinational DNA repair protein RecT